jgi:hypothetical protein
LVRSPGPAHGSPGLVKAHAPRRGRHSCRNTCYKPDYGPRYASGCGPRYAPDRGQRYALDQPQRHRAAGPFWPADGRHRYISMNRHRGPAPLEPAAGVSRRLCARGSDSADWSLHAAGPKNSDRATRLHLLGPATIGSGPGLRRRLQLSRAGTSRPRCGEIGKYSYLQSRPMTRWDLMQFHDCPL